MGRGGFSGSEAPVDALIAVERSSAVLHGEDFDCAVCWGLLLKPVVAACGHDFCSGCYYKCTLMLGMPCPMCREPLAAKVPAVCLRLEALISEKFPRLLEERRRMASDEDLADEMRRRAEREAEAHQRRVFRWREEGEALRQLRYWQRRERMYGRPWVPVAGLLDQLFGENAAEVERQVGIEVQKGQQLFQY